MFWLKLIRDFIKILREGQTPAQIAGGFAAGSLVGFSPLLTLQSIIIWIIILMLDINLSAAILSFTIFSIIAFILDPVFHWLGFQILTQVTFLKEFWTSLYNAPIAPLTRFYNTVVMGSLAFALVFFFPIYFGMKKFVIQYRKHIGNRVEKLKIYQILKKSSVVRFYTKLRDFGGVR